MGPPRFGCCILPGPSARAVSAYQPAAAPSLVLPMSAMQVEATLHGRLAAVTVRQRFDCTDFLGVALVQPESAEVVFVWPTDDSAVLYALSATTPERTITAALKPKAVAQAEYDTAKAAGQFAVHAHSSTTRETELHLGNVRRGWAVEVTVCYAVVLPVKPGAERVVAWWLPTFLTPRFGSDNVTGRQAITPSTAIHVQIRIVGSDGAEVAVSEPGASYATRNGDTWVTLDKTGGRGFQNELRVTVTHARELADRLLCAPVPATAGRAAGHALLYTGQLRFAHDVYPIDVAVVLDRSGSMYSDMGPKDARRRIDAVADGLKVLASTLRKGDRVSVSEFGSHGREQYSLPLSAWTAATKATLLANADAMLASDLGGTEPHTCLTTVLAQLVGAPPAEGGGKRLRAVLFFGDGDLGGGHTDIFTALESARRVHGVYTSVLAIGHGCNTDLLSRMSAQGHGLYEHVLEGKDMLQAIAGLVAGSRELPVHRVELAPLVVAAEDEGAAVAAEGTHSLDAWTTRTLAEEQAAAEAAPVAVAAPATTTTTTVPFTLKAAESEAVPVPVPEVDRVAAAEAAAAADLRAPPASLYAMTSPSVRTVTPLTLALLVPARAASVRLTAVFRVADPAAPGGAHEHRVHLDMPVEQTDVHPDDLVATLPQAVAALAGTTLLTEALRALDVTTAGSAARARVERGLAALAVQTHTNCRLTAWIAVDREGQPLPAQTPLPANAPPPQMAARRAVRLGGFTFNSNASAIAPISFARPMPPVAMATGPDMSPLGDGGHRTGAALGRLAMVAPMAASSLLGSHSTGPILGALPAFSAATTEAAPHFVGFGAGPVFPAATTAGASGFVFSAATTAGSASALVEDLVRLLARLQDVDGTWANLPADLSTRLRGEPVAAAAEAAAAAAVGADAARAATALVVAWLEEQLRLSSTSDYVRSLIQPMLQLARSSH
jgi:hypothetical protein